MNSIRSTNTAPYAGDFASFSAFERVEAQAISPPAMHDAYAQLSVDARSAAIVAKVQA